MKRNDSRIVHPPLHTHVHVVLDGDRAGRGAGLVRPAVRGVHREETDHGKQSKTRRFDASASQPAKRRLCESAVVNRPFGTRMISRKVGRSIGRPVGQSARHAVSPSPWPALVHRSVCFRTRSRLLAGARRVVGGAGAMARATGSTPTAANSGVTGFIRRPPRHALARGVAHTFFRAGVLVSHGDLGQQIGA